MSPLSRNVIGNFVGKLCTGLLTLGLVPVYVRLMGVESYGLVGVFATFQAVFLLLDMGLSMTLNRELARIPLHGEGITEARDLVRTLELPYWVATGIVLLCAWPLGHLIALYWVQPGHLSQECVTRAFILMGLAVGMQFPSALYSGGLMGLQRQILLNVINVASAAFRGLGAIAVLVFIDRGVEVFMGWQIVASTIQTGVTWRCLWGSLPGALGAPRFRKELLLKGWRFAGGVVAVTGASAILTQMDKIILCRILPLEDFGYYVMASVAAGAIGVVISPLFSAVFPRLAQIAASGDQEMLKQLYHKSCQLVAVLILPPTILLVFFSKDIMLLWTQSPTVSEHTCRVVSLLAVGTALNGFMSIPYALQLAHGWTRLALEVNLVAIFLLIPLLIFLSLRWGAQGAAWVWAILNAGYVLFVVRLMHRRLLSGELWRWFWEDFGLPLIAGIAVSGMVRVAAPYVQTQLGKVVLIVVAGIMSLAAAGLASFYIRSMVIASLRRLILVDVSKTP